MLVYRYTPEYLFFLQPFQFLPHRRQLPYHTSFIHCNRSWDASSGKCRLRISSPILRFARPEIAKRRTTESQNPTAGIVPAKKDLIAPKLIFSISDSPSRKIRRVTVVSLVDGCKPASKARTFTWMFSPPPFGSPMLRVFRATLFERFGSSELS